LIRAFSENWYRKGLDFGLTYLGVPIVKNPLDLWVYQEIVHETKPELIIETGTAWGGSALHMAHLLDAIGGDGHIISIDIKPQQPLPEHDRIDWWIGLSSIDPLVLDNLRIEAYERRCMVILDSDHTKKHVLAELNAYHRFVSKGCYLIVEDTNTDGYRQFLAKGDGPAEAVKEWQPANRGFTVDRDRERFGFSQNPDGYLRRVR
jgi:cephalosporin hydroxylase